MSPMVHEPHIICCYSAKVLFVVARELLNNCYGVLGGEISPPLNFYDTLGSRCGYRSFFSPPHDLSRHYCTEQTSCHKLAWPSVIFQGLYYIMICLLASRLFCVPNSAWAAGQQNGKQHAAYCRALLESESVICQSLCLCVMSSKKASARPPMQPMRAPCEAILTRSLESKLNASWYFSLHASPFVSFNYRLVVNKLLSCWCFINHSDCYDNMFVYSSLLQSWDSFQRCFYVNNGRVN